MTAGAGFHPHPSLGQAVPFLEALLQRANPNYFLEIRTIPRLGRPLQRYHKIQDLFQTGMALALPVALDGRANVYYGVCPRSKRSGKADAVGEAVTQMRWAKL